MYTTIIHPIRKALNLSCNEYCVLDTVYHLSNNVKFDGWCAASRQTLANELDLSKRTIITIIESLTNRGLIVLDGKTRYLRPSEEYCNAMQNKSDWAIAISGKNGFHSSKLVQESGGEETAPLPTQVVKKLHPTGEETSPSIDNNINNNNIYIVREVVKCLNKETDMAFKSESKETVRLINARIKEGYTLENFETVIKHKTREWLHDSVMKQYLRPITLFGNKFEGYLNASSTTKSKGNNIVPLGEGEEW